jgi:SecD/SecF fusion protein
MYTPRWKLITYTIIILAGIIAALPNLFTKEQLAGFPSWVPKQQITLGLDLRGGSYLVLEVDAAALVRERVLGLVADARTQLRTARIENTVQRREDGALVRIPQEAQRTQALTILRGLANAVSGFNAAAADLTVTPQGDGEFLLTLTPEGTRDRTNAAVEQNLEVVRRRIDEIGVAEPTVQRVGADRVLVALPGVQDPTRIRALLGNTAKLSFHMLGTDSPDRTPRPGFRVVPGAQEGARYVIEERIALAGDRLTDARLSFEQTTKEPVVSFRLDGVGARQFGEITRVNVGKPFAILLDDKVLSAPVIREPIMGGQGQISGNFSVQSATDLAALLRAGALPAPMTVIEERTVGPDMGADAIARGFETGLIGFVGVFLFMVFLYGTWGLIANLALALNTIMTLGILGILGATLTMPGIAGIVLGIGLAVDANVLINERIREETRKGARAIVALDAGFSRAYATIVDSNMTALIATALLFMFGSGPVQGFAVTMAIGIGISMFTAVSIVRVLMIAIVKWRKMKVLLIEPFFKFVPDNTNIKFMKARQWGILFSAILSTASVILFMTPGLNYGVDFKGGIQMEAVTQQPADTERMRAALEGLNIGEVPVTEFGSPNHVLIRAERQPGPESAQTVAVQQIREALVQVDPTVTIERTEVVGPKVSGELAEAGILSVIFASLAMLVYIWARFEWPFAVGAIATLILDVTKTVGFFALTGLEFNLTAIAALLTLIGYSVNDKVVVYDRMRENMRLYKQLSFREVIDKSINETLARSLYTSVTAFLAMLPMALFGGSAVSSFAIPMVFGIVIAASSSVFIAAPILLFLGDWRNRRRARMPRQAPVPSLP